MSKGLFISFEGGDGSGKSTQLGILEDKLKQLNREALFLREPGGTDISEQIRNIILDKDNVMMSPSAEALLYAASRIQLVDQVIIPALESGKIVVCDRYIDSSLAYQAYGRQLGDFVWDINRAAVEKCMPDITFLLKLDPKTGGSRIKGRELDRIELLSDDFHQRVYRGYCLLEDRFPDRIVGIDASDSIENISEIIFNKVCSLI